MKVNPLVLSDFTNIHTYVNVSNKIIIVIFIFYRPISEGLNVLNVAFSKTLLFTSFCIFGSMKYYV